MKSRVMTNGFHPRRIHHVLVACLFLVTLTSGVARSSQQGGSLPEANLSNRFAVNLLSSTTPIGPSALPNLDFFHDYLLYTTRFKNKGRVWYRLRLGFFPTEKEARVVLDSLRKQFPVAWVTRVSNTERRRAVQLSIALPASTEQDSPIRSQKRLPEPTGPIQGEKPSSEVSKKNKVKQEKTANASENSSKRFVVNLSSSLDPIDLSDLSNLDVLKEHRLYTTRVEIEGRTWHRLSLGFFPTERAARAVMKPILPTFPTAWVSRVTQKERLAAAPAALEKPSRMDLARPPQKSEEKGSSPEVSEERLKTLMETAKKAMTGGEYRRAVQYYTKILEYPDHPHRRDALELLGLARERNEQAAHARSEYEKYLRFYPEGEGSERVRQRLAGLVTARAKPKPKLRKAKKADVRTRTYGSFSMFYNRYESYPDVGEKRINQSSLSTDLDLSINRSTPTYDLSAFFYSGSDYDFLEDGAGGETTISQAYIDALDRRLHVSGRVGRQSRSTDGVLGRFDGVVLSSQLLPWLKINALSGFPVETTLLKTIDTDKHFYGLSLDLGTIAEHWDFNLYAINQEVDGITDRQAVGGEMRYSDMSRSFFSFVDYDISYDELVTVILVGNWIFPDNTTINTSFNYRKSPVVTTNNALMGQSVDSIADLLLTLSEDEIRALALDRSATSRFLTLGLTRPFNTHFQVGAEITVSEMGATVASGGVEAMPGTGYEFFYSTQLIGSSLIKNGDVAIIGLRYYDTSSSDTLSLDLNTRYPLNRAWRINPRMRINYSQIDRNDADQLKLRPSLRMDYYWKRRIRFELDGGVDVTYDWVLDEETRSLDFFLTLGYRVYF